MLKADALIKRALTYCDCAMAKGLLAIRTQVDTQVDTSEPSLLAVDALLDVKRLVAPYIDLQPVTFPQDGVLRSESGVDNLHRALDQGVDIVVGIPHFERTMANGAASVKLLCKVAAQHGKLVDMHCDESDDPLSRHIETLAYETQRLGLLGRVNGWHCTSMHSMDNHDVSKLLLLVAGSGVSVIANPLINITLQGCHDSHPKRRGMTRVPELMAAGVNVAFGHDCVADPWCSMGSGDMLEAAQNGCEPRASRSSKKAGCWQKRKPPRLSCMWRAARRAHVHALTHRPLSVGPGIFAAKPPPRKIAVQSMVATSTVP